MPVVLWDSLGTLLDLEPVRGAFAALGDPTAFEAWFEQILHTGAALAQSGGFAPFADVAGSTLPSLLARLGLDPAERGPLEALREEIRPHADAGPALDLLARAGIDSWVVTNGSRESTERAFERGGLGGRVRGIVSIDDVRAWKPDRAPYDEALRRAGVERDDACLVAAHAWDVHAAQAYGLRAVWVDRLEREWPLPGDAPAARAHDLPEAARLAARLS